MEYVLKHKQHKRYVESYLPNSISLTQYIEEAIRFETKYDAHITLLSLGRNDLEVVGSIDIDDVIGW